MEKWLKSKSTLMGFGYKIMVYEENVKCKIDKLTDNYVKAIKNKSAALFIGAGISSPSGFMDWEELVKNVASCLDIKIDKNMDLPEIIQYCVNLNKGLKSLLIQEILDEYSKKVKLNNYHILLKNLPVKTAWTTNYDSLLEETFKDRTVDVKIGNNSIGKDKPNADIIIYKMHGNASTSHADNIVITKEDYDRYIYDNEAFYSQLKSDLLSKTFLFLGYSLGDPNINQVLVQVRHALKHNPRNHYLLAKRKDDENEIKLQLLWADDLKRYGINVILLDDYKQIEDILRAIEKKVYQKNIFVTGSHETPLTDHYIHLGGELAKNNFLLMFGQSDGIGFHVAKGFINQIIDSERDIEKVFKIWPNVNILYDKITTSEKALKAFKQSRMNLIRETRSVILFDGGIGTGIEYNIAKEMQKDIYPMIWSGENAKKWLQELKKENYFKNFLSEREIDLLENLTEDNYIEEIIKLLSK